MNVYKVRCKWLGSTVRAWSGFAAIRAYADMVGSSLSGDAEVCLSASGSEVFRQKLTEDTWVTAELEKSVALLVE